MTEITILFIYIFLFGAIIGSFLNVCIYRLPHGMGLGGRSNCPHCKKQIPWYDNVPIFGYFLLRGRCRQCKTPFSIRYSLVELLTALLAVATFVKVASVPQFFLWFLLFVAPLIVVFFIDLDHQIIPDVISLPGIVAGFAVTLFHYWPDWIDALQFSTIGLLAGGGSLFLLGTVYLWVRKREGLGGGDVKLCAMLGAFLGWPSMILIFLISSILGSIVALTVAFRQQRSNPENEDPVMIAFGPFLVAGAFVVFFFGSSLVDFYSAIAGVPFPEILPRLYH